MEENGNQKKRYLNEAIGTCIICLYDHGERITHQFRKNCLHLSNFADALGIKKMKMKVIQIPFIYGCKTSQSKDLNFIISVIKGFKGFETFKYFEKDNFHPKIIQKRK